MPIALLLLAVAVDPMPVPVVKPPELPPALRDRLRVLLAAPLTNPVPRIEIQRDGLIDQTAAPLHRDELAQLECWLALRPNDDAKRRRAVLLAESLAQPATAPAHRAALGQALTAVTTEHPKSASARVRLAEWLVAAGRLPEAIGVARQAARLDPAAADAQIVLGAAGVGGGGWEEGFRTFDAAFDLAPTDWQVPAARATARCFLLEQLPTPELTRAAVELSAVEFDRQSGVRLGGSDPACLRWSANTALRICTLTHRAADPATATRRSMDLLLPALAQLADASPADSRAVMLAVQIELMVRLAANDLPPAAGGQRNPHDCFPPDAQARVHRWLRRTADAVAVDDGPEAAEKAVTAARLFCSFPEYDRAIAAAKRAVALRPNTPHCEEALQSTLLFGGRAADALTRCRAGGAGRLPTEDAQFEVRCLQSLGRWDEARRVAGAAAERFPDDHGLALAVAGCRLHEATPGAIADADARVAAVWRAVADRRADDLTRQQATRLQVISHLLAGRFTEADALLEQCQRTGLPIRDEAELTAAARPLSWPAERSVTPLVVPAGVR